MFRRTFWFTAGAATGVWATTKVQAKLRRLTPESLAAQAADKAVEAGYRLKEFALDVRAGMVRREEELNDALGIAPGSEPAPGREIPKARRPAPLANERPYTPHNRNEDH